MNIRTCLETNEICDHCNHEILITSRTKIDFRDFEKNDFLFCSYECKSKYLENFITRIYEKIDDVYYHLDLTFKLNQEESELEN